MSEKVYFIKLTLEEPKDTIEKKLTRLFKRSNLGKCFGKKDLVGIKIHVGEKGNTAYIQPHNKNK